MPFCNICREDSAQVEEAAVRSNVRKFGNTKFRIWRCPKCLSVHASDDVDLASAYQDYPYHQVGKQDTTRWMIRAGYRNLLGRLRKAGLKRGQRLLDYGCGGGEFVGYLREQGYDAVGYDEYSQTFGDASVLAAKYDFVLSQDVIEHVAEPWEHVRTLAALAASGGVIALGTPNSEIYDMKNPEQYVHALHQPYHRHIFSKRALLTIGERFGWQLLACYTSFYAETLVPCMNGRFFAYYVQTGDNTLDYALEPIRFDIAKMYTPAALFWALFGSFFTPEDNVMVLYRTPLSARDG